MKLKKILRSLMQVNDETADKIMKDYPAGCNADKVFDKSFKKYLLQKSMLSSDETTSFDESESSFTPSVEKRHFNRFFKTGGIAFATTAYIAAFIILLNITNHSPSPEINSPDTLIDRSIAEIQPDTDEKDVISTHEPSSENTEATPVSSSKVSNSKKNMTSTTSSANDENIPPSENTPTDIQLPPDEPIPEPTKNPTEPAKTSAVSAETTVNAKTTIAAETSAVPETTQAPDNPGGAVPNGYFEMQCGTYDYYGELWDKLVFVHSGDNVDVHEHSYEIDGFTIIYENKEDHSVFLADENGTVFPIYVFSYDEFFINLNPKLNRTFQISQTDGREVIREFRSLSDTIELTAWDDGCHICFTYAKREDYDQVEFLIRNFK